MRPWWILITIYAQASLTCAQPYQEVFYGFNQAKAIHYLPGKDEIATLIGHKIKFFKSGIPVGQLKLDGPASKGVFIHPNGQRILTYSDHHIKLTNLSDHRIESQWKSQDRLIETIWLGENILGLSNHQLTVWNDKGKAIEKIINYQGEFRAMGYQQDHSTIFTCGTDRRLAEWNLQGQLVNETAITHDHIVAMDVSADGRLVALASSTGQVDLHNAETGLKIRTMLTGEGRIHQLTFSNGDKYLGVGGKFLHLLSVNQTHRDIAFKENKSEIIRFSFSPDGKEITTLEGLNPYGKIYNISNLHIPSLLKFREDRDVIAPQIYVSNPPKINNNTINYSKDFITIEGSVFDDYGVRRLWINEIETPIKENGAFIIHLPLANGENPVALEAFDVNGNISAKRFTINRKREIESYDAQVAGYHLLAIGIDQYRHWNPLRNAVKDVNNLASVLLEDYTFDFSTVTTIKNEQATKKNILESLRKLIEIISPQDNLLIYFSGHGHFDELLNEGYWVPVDAPRHSPVDYISNSSVLKVIENVHSQHTLLIADACFSGSLFANKRGEIGGGYIQNVEKYRSRWGLASGRLEVVSDGQPGTNSPFAAVLLHYLQHHPKQAFAISELVQHVKMVVAEQHGQTPIGSPLRLESDEGGEFIFRRKGRSN